MPVQQKKIINLLEKKNTCKKTPKEDSELGYSDFTLTLTIHLPHPQQKGIQFSPMHKNLNTRVVGEANLWRKRGVDQQDGGSGSPESTSSTTWTPSVVSSATSAPSVVPPTISTVRELDAPAANSDALIWCASSSASEALLAASISRCSFFLARASSSARPLRLLACSRGGGG